MSACAAKESHQFRKDAKLKGSTSKKVSRDHGHQMQRESGPVRESGCGTLKWAAVAARLLPLLPPDPGNSNSHSPTAYTLQFTVTRCASCRGTASTLNCITTVVAEFLLASLSPRSSMAGRQTDPRICDCVFIYMDRTWIHTSHKSQFPLIRNMGALRESNRTRNFPSTLILDA